jgi:hypothetical protein
MTFREAFSLLLLPVSVLALSTPARATPAGAGGSGDTTSTACPPGGQFACPCPGGAIGVQTCTADGMSVGACGECTDSFACAPSATIPCLCITGGIGIQDCNAQGDGLGACRECPDPGIQPGCVPGAQFACGCGQRGTGTQVCRDDGQGLEACAGCSTGAGGEGGSPSFGEASDAEGNAYSSCAITASGTESTGFALLAFPAIVLLARRRSHRVRGND